MCIATVVSNVPSSDNDDNSVSVAVISEAVVGTLLLIIIIISVIVIVVILVILFCSRGKKESLTVCNDKVKLPSHIPNCHRHTDNTSQHDHTGISTLSQLGAEVDESKAIMEVLNTLYIPTQVKSVYSSLQHDDVIITPSPSYAVGPNSSETGKECEYQYDYVQTDDGSVQHDKIVGATTSGGETMMMSLILLTMLTLILTHPIHYDLMIKMLALILVHPMYSQWLIIKMLTLILIHPNDSLPQDGQVVKLVDNPSYAASYYLTCC